MAEQSHPPQWSFGLDERTIDHIAFARHYAQHFAHGAPGHLDLMTIAKLADLLDRRSDLWAEGMANEPKAGA